MGHLTRKFHADKPAKAPRARQTKYAHLLPYPDFPLFPHAGTRWAKVIRGARRYFGRVADGWEAALDKYNREKDDLHAGRAPRAEPEGVTVDELVNSFIHAKRQKVDTSELTPRTWADYKTVCIKIKSVFGAQRVVEDLRPQDFDRLRSEFAKTHGPKSLEGDVTRVRVVFKWAHLAGLIDRAVKFGPEFKAPSRKTLLKARQAKGSRMFTAAELRKIIGAAGVPLKAMILLGVNAGMGNGDCGHLPMSAIDFKNGWANYPRVKTAVERRIPLWPETIAALKAAIDARPTPKDEADADLLFITAKGLSWAKARKIKTIIEGDKTTEKVVADNPISKETRKLLDELKITHPGATFYSLRHVFQTIGEESGDQVATKAIMGHAPSSNDMSAVYRERIADERLQRVVNHVRTWLLESDRDGEEKPADGWTL